MANKTDSPSLDELFAEAFAEDEAAKQAVEPVVEETVVEEEGEQPEEVAVPAKLSDVIEQPSVEDSIKPTVDLAQKVTLPDGTEATIQDLIAGNMRNKDYTQKTQKLSAASELYELLQEDPEGTILALAQKVGVSLTAEPTFNQQRKVKDVSKIVKGDDDKIAELVEAKTKELLEEYRKNDPVIREMEIRQSQAKVQQEFDRIQDAYGYPLDEADRNALIQVAIKNNEPNLEYLFLKARSAFEAKKAEAERINQGRVRKTAGTPVPTTADALKVKPKTLDEAWKLAELQLANS